MSKRPNTVVYEHIMATYTKRHKEKIKIKLMQSPF